MNKFSSRQVVFFLSFLLTILAGIMWMVFLKNTAQLLFVFIGLSVFFLITCFLLQYAINNFILEKIMPIYKIIDFVPKKGKEEKLKSDQGFVELSKVEQDVETWAYKQIQEIERLKELERYRKDFVGNVSHELKTLVFNKETVMDLARN